MSIISSHTASPSLTLRRLGHVSRRKWCRHDSPMSIWSGVEDGVREGLEEAKARGSVNYLVQVPTLGLQGCRFVLLG